MDDERPLAKPHPLGGPNDQQKKTIGFASEQNAFEMVSASGLQDGGAAGACLAPWPISGISGVSLRGEPGSGQVSAGGQTVTSPRLGSSVPAPLELAWNMAHSAEQRKATPVELQATGRRISGRERSPQRRTPALPCERTEHSALGRIPPYDAHERVHPASGSQASQAATMGAAVASRPISNSSMSPVSVRPPSAAALLAMAAAAASTAASPTSGVDGMSGTPQQLSPSSLPHHYQNAAARASLELREQMVLPPRPSGAVGGARPVPLHQVTAALGATEATRTPAGESGAASPRPLAAVVVPTSAPAVTTGVASGRGRDSSGSAATTGAVHNAGARWRDAAPRAAADGTPMQTRRSATAAGSKEPASGDAVPRRSHRASSVANGGGGSGLGPPGSSGPAPGHGDSSAAASGTTAMRRSKSMPAPAEKHRRDNDNPGPKASPALRKGRSNHGASSLPRANAAAAAGPGSVAAKVRKKGVTPRKMVLPFSYGVDDPRHYHVESTEGRICPEFLPL